MKLAPFKFRVVPWCVAAALMIASAANAASLSIFNTGVDPFANALLGNGTPDPHYSLIVQPGAATAVTVDPTNYPFPPWIANTTGSRWIGPAADSQGPAGNYVYRTTFTVPPSAILGSVAINGDWATDDPGTDIKINGISTGQNSNFFTTLQPFSVTSGFVIGLNTLDFYLTNAGGPTGLRVDKIVGTYQVPEPLSATLFAAGLSIAVTCTRRRR